MLIKKDDYRLFLSLISMLFSHRKPLFKKIPYTFGCLFIYFVFSRSYWVFRKSDTMLSVYWINGSFSLSFHCSCRSCFY